MSKYFELQFEKRSSWKSAFFICNIEKDAFISRFIFKMFFLNKYKNAFSEYYALSK